MQLSIVVPVYRSAECLPELVRCIEKEVADYFQIYELILVNDDSPDRAGKSSNGSLLNTTS